MKKLRGRTGPRGPSDVYEAFTNDPAEPQVLRLSVPAGSYSVVAKAVAASGTSGSDTGGAGCMLSGPGDNDYSVNKMPPSTVAAFSNALVATLKQPGQFSYECNGSGGTTAYEGFYQVRIVATRVANATASGYNGPTRR